MTRSSTFTFGGEAIRYRWQRGHGPEHSLLVHGIGMAKDYFAGLAESLRRRGSTWSVDLPGFGDSPEPERAFGIVQHAELLARFIQAQARLTGLREATLVGHSMGAQVVAELAARHPELVHRLVLLAPTVNPAERTAAQQALRLGQDLLGERIGVLATGAWLYAKAGPAWFGRQLQAMLEHRLELALPRIVAPTLVIRGEDDAVCPREWGERVAQLLPLGSFRELRDRGHETFLNAPAPVAALIQEQHWRSRRLS